MAKRRKKIGSKLCAFAYIVLKNGTTVFVDEFEHEIERKMKKKSIIKLDVAGLSTKTISVKTSDIDYYGEL